MTSFLFSTSNTSLILLHSIAQARSLFASIVDGSVKSPDAALRFILRHCGVQQSTLHSSGFARLACGLFTKPSCIQGCCIFLREHHSLSALRRTWLDLNGSTLRAESALSSPLWG